MTQVLAIGETLAAFRVRGGLRVGSDTSFSFVGAESNVAIGLARLGHDVAWAGAFGDDLLAQTVMRALRAEGVDCDSVRVDADHPTGIVVFDGPMADLRRVTYFRRNSAGSRLGAAEMAAIRARKPLIVHVSGITSALGPDSLDVVRSVIREAHSAGALVSFDVNYRAGLWDHDSARTALAELARASDIVFATERELELISEPNRTLDDQAHALGVTEVVVKREDTVASAYVKGERTDVPFRARRVVDPVGAGDGFAAGYLSARLDDLGVAERLRRAHAVAAFAVTNPGDWEGLPRRAELPLAGQYDNVAR